MNHRQQQQGPPRLLEHRHQECSFQNFVSDIPQFTPHNHTNHIRLRAKLCQAPDYYTQKLHIRDQIQESTTHELRKVKAGDTGLANPEFPKSDRQIRSG